MAIQCLLLNGNVIKLILYSLGTFNINPNILFKFMHVGSLETHYSVNLISTIYSST